LLDTLIFLRDLYSSFKAKLHCTSIRGASEAEMLAYLALLKIDEALPQGVYTKLRSPLIQKAIRYRVLHATSNFGAMSALADGSPDLLAMLMRMQTEKARDSAYSREGGPYAVLCRPQFRPAIVDAYLSAPVCGTDTSAPVVGEAALELIAGFPWRCEDDKAAKGGSAAPCPASGWTVQSSPPCWRVLEHYDPEAMPGLSWVDEKAQNPLYSEYQKRLDAKLAAQNQVLEGRGVAGGETSVHHGEFTLADFSKGKAVSEDGAPETAKERRKREKREKREREREQQGGQAMGGQDMNQQLEFFRLQQEQLAQGQQERERESARVAQVEAERERERQRLLEEQRNQERERERVQRELESAARAKAEAEARALQAKRDREAAAQREREAAAERERQRQHALELEKERERERARQLALEAAAKRQREIELQLERAREAERNAKLRVAVGQRDNREKRSVFQSLIKMTRRRLRIKRSAALPVPGGLGVGGINAPHMPASTHASAPVLKGRTNRSPLLPLLWARGGVTKAPLSPSPSPKRDRWSGPLPSVSPYKAMFLRDGMMPRGLLSDSPSAAGYDAGVPEPLAKRRASTNPFASSATLTPTTHTASTTVSTPSMGKTGKGKRGKGSKKAGSHKATGNPGAERVGVSTRAGGQGVSRGKGASSTPLSLYGSGSAMLSSPLLTGTRPQFKDAKRYLQALQRDVSRSERFSQTLSALVVSSSAIASPGSTPPRSPRRK
ncbi:hypothetical protein KIPB_001831, partial [Kipferlia bialata]